MFAELLGVPQADPHHVECDEAGKILDIPVAWSRGFRVEHGMTEC
jgi:hypothetical protein